MKRTGLLLVIILLLALTSCSLFAMEDAGKTPVTDSEILRSRYFNFEAVQEYFGKSIVFTASVQKTEGYIKISAGEITDSYSFSDGKIFQIKNGIGEIDITETDAGKSLINLTETLCGCPDAIEGNSVFLFSEDGNRLLSVQIDDIILRVSKIEYTANA